MLKKDSSIFIAGHRGMVGSAIYRFLRQQRYQNLVTRSRDQLDLTDQNAVRQFFTNHAIDHVILAAARVGGIQANNIYPAEFIYQNLMIESNVIHQAFQSGVKQLLFLGSSCIYPKNAPQPMQEECLLSGYLESTNAPYAIAKIAGIKLCESYNRQYGTDYRAVMPTNLYGPCDNFDLEDSHVLPALIRKFHLAKLARDGKWDLIQKDESTFGTIPADLREILKSTSLAKSNGTLPDEPIVRLWGSGSAKREFLHVDDLASACLTVMTLTRQKYQQICRFTVDGLQDTTGGRKEPDQLAQPPASHVNVGTGKDLTIKELAGLIKSAVGYQGSESWDQTKPDGTPRKLLDISRLNKAGWHPRIKLMDGIRGTYDWYLQQRL
jgi:GDP-L-fucose synthase